MSRSNNNLMEYKMAVSTTDILFVIGIFRAPNKKLSVKKKRLPVKTHVKS